MSLGPYSHQAKVRPEKLCFAAVDCLLKEQEDFQFHSKKSAENHRKELISTQNFEVSDPNCSVTLSRMQESELPFSLSEQLLRFDSEGDQSIARMIKSTLEGFQCGYFPTLAAEGTSGTYFLNDGTNKPIVSFP
eukprot:TRINITY_DN21935_c0_g1_i1.p2 TRINITY_DN21935_c0_g1~~TRINITY_DN21935_c0_g1_i1.p2  ORF type:complete len:134 (-),score=9.89 TRINITY_DN21935_c0_g1_i1:829-1230(-)